MGMNFMEKEGYVLESVSYLLKIKLIKTPVDSI